MNTQLRQGEKKRKKRAKQSYQGHRQLPGREKNRHRVRKGIS